VVGVCVVRDVNSEYDSEKPLPDSRPPIINSSMVMISNFVEQQAQKNGTDFM
jgi:hypothetical protein